MLEDGARAAGRVRPSAIVHEGDCLEVLRTIPDSSVDSIVTDPPAGIGFMGKEWDQPGALVERQSRRHEKWDMPGGNHHPRNSADKYRTIRAEGAKFRAFLTPIFEECIRVLKPGGHAVVWALPRTSHWTGSAIEEAGFEVRDVVVHHFGSGFPKSLDVSKAIDMRGGNPQLAKQVARALAAARKARGVTVAEADRLFCNGSTNYSWFEGRPKGTRLPMPEEFDRIVSAWPELAPLRDRVAEAARETIGHKDSGLDQTASVSVDFKGATGRDETGLIPITAPSTPAAQEWAGWGTALKPASEFWILARKPLEGTIAENVVTHRTGGLNIGACRVGSETRTFAPRGIRPGSRNYVGDTWDPLSEDKVVEGRWPANLILSHSDECLEGACSLSCPVAEIDRQSGIRAAGHFPKNTGASGMWSGSGGGLNGCDRIERYTEKGGASRFFYVAKPPRKEKDAGLDELLEQTADAYAQHRGRRMSGPSRMDGKPPGRGRNTHPTVKPIQLMRFLVRLVTPPGGTTLDPFTGSGTTGCAAMREGRNFIGIEREPEYVQIARRRIKAAAEG